MTTNQSMKYADSSKDNTDSVWSFGVDNFIITSHNNMLEYALVKRKFIVSNIDGRLK